MYHLQEDTYWYNDYSHNLDSAGVWGIQGPLGPTGALGALGALGPLGISLQYGVTTTSDGVYQVDGKTIRRTIPVRYTHDASKTRTYDLFEMYSKSYALKMGKNGVEPNDWYSCNVAAFTLIKKPCVCSSFAVDSYLSEPNSGGDVFQFTSAFDQFVHINVVPVNMYSDYAISLKCCAAGTTTKVNVATANSNPFASTGGLEDFIVVRLRPSEVCDVIVTVQSTSNGKFGFGYYLFVTGTALSETSTQRRLRGEAPVNGEEAQERELSSIDDIWGARTQSSGINTFNIIGPHQTWEKFN